MAAKQNSRNRQQQQRGSMPWGPMLLSFAVGAFVMFLVHLKDNVPADGTPKIAQQQKKSAGIEPTFDFYTLLPESEEVVTRPQAKQQAIVTAPPEETVEPETPIPAETAKGEITESYMIQVGSFKKLSDADAYRAKLAFLGFESKVQTVTIDDKDTWHRVQIGPIAGRAQADAMQKQLRENAIDSLLLRAKHS
ncbi:MAG TPA: SPOR domain-containing protein [Methylophaga sp.]|nr:SPOR domain-containing protein [Methylophaga sp.]